MKHFIILAAFSCNVIIATAQDSTDYYIKGLNWQSVFLKITYGTELVLSKGAEKLIQNKSDKTAKKLFCAMFNENKTAIAHIILSRMYEPQNGKLRAEYVYDKDTVIAISYSCNKLNWRFDIKTERYSIDSSTAQMTKEYWKENLPPLREMSLAAKRKLLKRCKKD